MAYVSRKPPQPGRQEDDATWFRARPERRYRLRRAQLPDELSAPWVIVHQLKPGVRVRAEVVLDSDTPCDDESSIRRRFAQVSAQNPFVPRIITQAAFAFGALEPEGRA
jgi:hypothetical protein